MFQTFRDFVACAIVGCAIGFCLTLCSGCSTVCSGYAAQVNADDAHKRMARAWYCAHVCGVGDPGVTQLPDSGLGDVATMRCAGCWEERDKEP